MHNKELESKYDVAISLLTALMLKTGVTALTMEEVEAASNRGFKYEIVEDTVELQLLGL